MCCLDWKKTLLRRLFVSRRHWRILSRAVIPNLSRKPNWTLALRARLVIVTSIRVLWNPIFWAKWSAVKELLLDVSCSFNHFIVLTLWTSGSSVRPKVVKSVHYCPVTKKTLERKYTDFTSYDSFPTANTYPKEAIIIAFWNLEF